MPVRIANAVALAATAVLLAAGAATPASAAQFAVTKVADTADGACDADCSLREAIIRANANPDADVIDLPAGAYTLTIAGSGEDDAATGDLDIRGPLTIAGAGARTTSVSGAGGDRVFEVDASSGDEVTLSGMLISGGGGVTQGAGIFVSSLRAFTLRDAAVVSNTTSAAATTSTRQGAGIFLNNAPSVVERVLVAGNSATSIAGDSFAPQGAGIFVNGGPTSLRNVTIAGNTADGRLGGSFGPQGAGIFVNDPVTMTNVTIASNSAVDTVAAQVQGPAIFYNAGATMQQVVVGGNDANGAATADQCFNNDVVTSAGTNLAPTAAACGFTQPGDQNADPLLGALADNGGPTGTIAPAAGSPVIDRVPFAACPADDQRGVLRAGLGSACDLGALETGTLAAPPSPPPSPPPPPAAPAAPQPVAPKPRPKPKPISAVKAFALPSAKRCVSRRSFRIRIRKIKGITFVRATVLVRGKRVKVLKGKRLTAPVNLKRLPKGRFTVKIIAFAKDGRKITGTRRYRTCTPKRRTRKKSPRV